MQPSKPARRYAGAAFGLAQELGCAQAFLSDMAELARLIGESPELAGFLTNYSIPRQKRSGILESLFRARVHDLTWRFLRFVEEKRRTGLLAEIVEALHDLSAQEAGIRKALLTTAMPLEEPDLRMLTARIEQLAGGPVDLKAVVKPSLVGGFCVQIGDRLHDLSIAASLLALKETMIYGQKQSGQPV
jgi:F-type H+-transporting ATPase subunit delta